MVAPKIAPIDQSKLRESVYSALRDAFTRGEFAPGDTVSLRTLAQQLGTSMTPVREAVRRLVAEGALVDTPSRTLIVPPFNARRMADLKAARLALETLVLDQAMERMTAADIDALAQVISAPRNLALHGPDLETNYRFHFQLYGLSGSEILLPVIEALWLQYGAYLNRIIAQDSARAVEEHLHHNQIIDALHRGDKTAARAALQADIERSFSILATRVDPD